MSTPVIISLVILVVLVAAFIALYFFGKNMQKKQMAQKEQMREAAQMTSMLIIDKKMMKMKEAGLPKVVMDQTPKRYRNAKLPIVKAKVGPQTINLICDDGIFDELPTKTEVKAMVSGIYIVEIKSIRGKKKNKAEEPVKKGFGAKMRAKQRELQRDFEKEEMSKEAKKAAKAEEKKKKERAKKITQ